MKRLIALVLVVLMLGSTAAFAADDTMLGVSSENAVLKTEAGSGTAATELWLQVDAEGQIDVTVPLVLVFRTNIDGGKAQAATNYMITNNNNAPVVVTDVVVSEGRTTDPTKLVAYKADKALYEDEYMVQLTADAVAGTDGKTVFDFMTGTYTNPASAGGLFKLNRDTANKAAEATTIKAEMATGSFSFVTKRDANDGFDKTQGVHLNTVTYTVAFDTSVEYGTTIQTVAQNDDTPVTVPAYDDLDWNQGTDNISKTVTATPDDDTQGGGTTNP